VIVIRRSSLLCALLAGLVLLPVAVQAGPPLLCFPIDIGGATSLPWGSAAGWNAPRPGYDRAHLVNDTLAVLSPATPVLVRMETLRRAAIYAMNDAGLARELLAKIEGRVREDPSDPPAALALFDAGYLIEVYKQARAVTGRDLVDRARDGYAMVERALARLGSPPDMEYAAALVALDGRREASRVHLAKAREGAPAGSLVSRAIESHERRWGR